MEDARIIDLYFSRSEEAIGETAAKYGPYCASIAMSILNDPEDAEESVNDTWLAAWNRMPPERPNVLAVFLGRMTRNISIDRWRQYHSFKRSGSQVTLALEELDGCVSGKESPENEAIRRETLRSIQCFLDTLSQTSRMLTPGATNRMPIVAMRNLLTPSTWWSLTIPSISARNSSTSP